MMFRNVPPSSESEERPDELFAVISVEEETGKLLLTVYEILLDVKGALEYPFVAFCFFFCLLS